MKFEFGDDLDRKLCIALKHEFLRCDDAFHAFEVAALNLVAAEGDRRFAYTAYNAYARFVHHLYEFLISAASRELKNVSSLPAVVADQWIAMYTQRVLTNAREAIISGRDPSRKLENIPVRVPLHFPREFRSCRHVAIGHASYKRASMSLSAFFNDNHGYLYLLYADAGSWWGRQTDEFPDLEEITAFSLGLAGPTPDSVG